MRQIKRIILFRFHDHFNVCRNHLAIIKKYNPGIEIYGLYGGEQKNFPEAKKLPLKHLWMVPLDDPYWKWTSGDLCVRWWFKEFGKTVKFDMLHIVEWDLILLESMKKQFAHVHEGVAISGTTPMARIYNTWDWVAPRRGRKEWLRLKKFVTKKFNYRDKPLVGIFGGASMSRKFLERYSQIEVPSLCNDEVRVPLFAQAFHMPVHNTNLRNKFFSAGEKEISPGVLYSQYKKGIWSFHPVKKKIDIGRLIKE